MARCSPGGYWAAGELTCLVRQHSAIGEFRHPDRGHEAVGVARLVVDHEVTGAAFIDDPRDVGEGAIEEIHPVAVNDQPCALYDRGEALSNLSAPLGRTAITVALRAVLPVLGLSLRRGCYPPFPTAVHPPLHAMVDPGIAASVDPGRNGGHIWLRRSAHLPPDRSHRQRPSLGSCPRPRRTMHSC